MVRGSQSRLWSRMTASEARRGWGKSGEPGQEGVK